MAVVLLVGGDPGVGAAIRSALQTAGHTLVEAVVFPARPAPDVDLVLIDLAARPDAIDVVREIKTSPDRAVASTRVGVLASTGTDQERLEAAIEGVVLYLTRPLDPEQLRRNVAHVLNGEPEEVQRKRVQDAALRAVVRLDRAGDRERKPVSARHEAAVVPPVGLRRDLSKLSDRQRAVLHAIATSDTREEARLRLGISRSLMGATLRTAASRLRVSSVSRLVELAREDLGGGRAEPSSDAPLRFEPVVTLATGRPCFLEAKGSLGWEMLRATCEAAARWRSDPALADVGVSTDVPARLLGDEGADRLVALLDRTGLPPDAFIVEVADIVALVGDDRARRGWARLRDAGVLMGVDRLGSELSPSASLLGLDIDVVKLDPVLVQRARAGDHSVLTGFVAFARSVAPVVVGEGVATEAQLTALDEAGCTAVQGPWVGGPSPRPGGGATSDRVRLSSLEMTSLGGLSSVSDWPPPRSSV